MNLVETVYCITLVIVIVVVILFIIWYTLRKNRNDPSELINTDKTKQIQPNRIAFLFLVYDKVNHENLWKQFFETCQEDKYSIYVHFKNNVHSSFFDKFKLKKCIETKYADITLVQAHKLLMEVALKDSRNFKFINVSQACIPLKSFDTVYEKLTATNQSYFNLMPKKDIFPRCNVLLRRGFNRREILKSSNWFILNRTHAQLCVETSHTKFNDIESPEEHFFIITVTMQSKHSDIVISNNEASNTTTFTNWSDMDYPFASGHPKTYCEISTEEIQYLLNSPALFGRKFETNCNNLTEHVLCKINQ